MQTITVADGKISGTLKYYDGSGWAAGTWAEDEKAGNFMALQASSDDGCTIVAKLIGGSGNQVTLDSDKNLVVRVAPDATGIKFTATKNGVTQTEVYKFALKLEEE